jgi:hypothetical protein
MEQYCIPSVCCISVRCNSQIPLTRNSRPVDSGSINAGSFYSSGLAKNIEAINCIQFRHACTHFPNALFDVLAYHTHIDDFYLLQIRT